MEKVISVCDREADIIEYLTYKTAHQQSFVIRSFHNRNLSNEDERLYQFSESLKPGGTVGVTQKVLEIISLQSARYFMLLYQ